MSLFFFWSLVPTGKFNQVFLSRQPAGWRVETWVIALQKGGIDPREVVAGGLELDPHNIIEQHQELIVHGLDATHHTLASSFMSYFPPCPTKIPTLVVMMMGNGDAQRLLWNHHSV